MDITRYEMIYDAVRQIPRGKVATYGQVARIVDRCTARMVGYAMAALRGRTDVPWQRVINAKGEISPRSRGDGALRQRKLLEKEGIHFDSRGRVNLRKALWNGRDRRSQEKGRELRPKAGRSLYNGPKANEGGMDV
jgi:methylated-DNA-protein-cysteine methyltransferase-like protein